MNLEAGTLVEFRLHGERRLAVADHSHGKTHWVVVDETGQAHTIHPRQITHAVTGMALAPHNIGAFLREVRPHLDPSCLELAWEYLAEEGDSVGLETLAELLFAERTPATRYATHCLLFDDKLFFKQKGERFEPRSRHQVEELRHQLEVTRQRQVALEAFCERATQRTGGEEPSWTRDDLARLQALERYVEQEGESPDRGAAQEVLAALARPKTPDSAFSLLVELGRWSPHENLFLRRSRFHGEHGAAALAAAERVLRDPSRDPDSQRLELTHLKVYTIDDTNTREIDDGLSLEPLADGRERVWVHIADPTRLLQPGDELDEEACSRGTTLYLPEGMIPMFPLGLATGPMSLLRDEVCAALSFGILLTPEGGIESFILGPALIRPRYRLSYEEVDAMLSAEEPSEPELTALLQIAQLRGAWRTAQGAISLSMPEASVQVRGDEISVKRIDDTPARTLVSEMMILAGQAAADYGIRHGIPLPFRFQPQAKLPDPREIEALPAGAARECAIRRCMPRTGIGTTPQPHAGLGLAAYVQASSPIRRYTDLVTHFQLKAHLRGEPPPFDADALERRLHASASLSLEAARLERQTKRYWALEFLRRSAGRVWEALLLRWLRPQEGVALVLLEELGLELVAHLKAGPGPGEKMRLAVAHADPRQDELRLRPA